MEPRVLLATWSRIAVRVAADGAAELPVIFASRELSATEASATVPVAVIGEPPVVTPEAPTAQVGSAPAPAVRRNNPAVPGASATHPVPLRYSRVPRTVVNSAASRKADSVFGIAGPELPEMFAIIVPVGEVIPAGNAST